MPRVHTIDGSERPKRHRYWKQREKLYTSVRKALKRAGYSEKLVRKSITGAVIRSYRFGMKPGPALECWARVSHDQQGGWFEVQSGRSGDPETYQGRYASKRKKYRSKGAAARAAIAAYKTCRKG
jgi:hypothetical protein